MDKYRRVANLMLASATMAVLAATATGETPKLKIETRNGSPREERKKEQIERLAKEYDLKKVTITRHIIIEQGVRPHSSPVLTMNAMFPDNDDLTLGTYVHEQGHWLLMQRGRERNRELLNDLLRAIPGLPTRFPEGSGDEPSTYFHLAVILLEWQGLEELVGVERARAVMDFQKTDHYTAIYPAVIEHREALGKILRRHSLKW